MKNKRETSGEIGWGRAASEGCYLSPILLNLHSVEIIGERFNEKGSNMVGV